MSARSGRVLLGLLVVIIGVVWFLQVAGAITTIPWDWVLPAVLIIVGVVLLADARGPNHGGLIALGIIITIVLLTQVGTRYVSTEVLQRPSGEVTEHIVDIAQLDNYSMLAGDLTLDLRDLDLPPGTTTLDVSVFTGKIDIRVPQDATVKLKAGTFTGVITAFGERRSGVGVTVEKTYPGPSDRTLVLEVSSFAGEIGVSR